MFVIEETGDLFANAKHQGTVWRPKGVHPEAMGLIKRWKELYELTQKIRPSIYSITAGRDYDEVSAAIRFAVPSESWKDGNKLDKDLRKLMEDMIEMGYDRVALDTDIPIEGNEEMLWIFSIVAFGNDPILALAPSLQYAARAVKTTRLEEFVITPAKA